MILGEKIRELRTAKGLTLKQLADMSGGYSSQFLCDIEHGRRYPESKVLTLIAKTLGVSFKSLKELDVRYVFEDLQRVTWRNPEWAIAMQRIMEAGVTPQELIELARKKKKEEV
jgi:transcriptional regulator with XRE-family HTH domain